MVGLREGRKTGLVSVDGKVWKEVEGMVMGGGILDELVLSDEIGDCASGREAVTGRGGEIGRGVALEVIQRCLLI